MINVNLENIKVGNVDWRISEEEDNKIGVADWFCNNVILHSDKKNKTVHAIRLYGVKTSEGLSISGYTSDKIQTYVKIEKPVSEIENTIKSKLEDLIKHNLKSIFNGIYYVLNDFDLKPSELSDKIKRYVKTTSLTDYVSSFNNDEDSIYFSKNIEANEVERFFYYAIKGKLNTLVKKKFLVEDGWTADAPKKPAINDCVNYLRGIYSAVVISRYLIQNDISPNQLVVEMLECIKKMECARVDNLYKIGNEYYTCCDWLFLDKNTDYGAFGKLAEVVYKKRITKQKLYDLLKELTEDDKDLCSIDVKEFKRDTMKYILKSFSD